MPKYTVWSNEDGDYFGEGHIPAEAFKEACLEYDVQCLGEEHDSDLEGCGEMRIEDVRHSWWKKKGLGAAEDDEPVYVRCEPDSEGAEPWTEWRR